MDEAKEKIFPELKTPDAIISVDTNNVHAHQDIPGQGQVTINSLVSADATLTPALQDSAIDHQTISDSMVSVDTVSHNLAIEEDVLDFEDFDDPCKKSTDGLEKVDSFKQSSERKKLNESKKCSKEVLGDNKNVDKDEVRDHKQVEDSTNLWVSGISLKTKAKDLLLAFSQFGTVTGAKILANSKAAGAKCFALVTMGSSDEAAVCIKEQGNIKILGRIVSIKYAKSSMSFSKTFGTTPAENQDIDDSYFERQKESRSGFCEKRLGHQPSQFSNRTRESYVTNQTVQESSFVSRSVDFDLSRNDLPRYEERSSTLRVSKHSPGPRSPERPTSHSRRSPVRYQASHQRSPFRQRRSPIKQRSPLRRSPSTKRSPFGRSTSKHRSPPQRSLPRHRNTSPRPLFHLGRSPSMHLIHQGRSPPTQTGSSPRQRSPQRRSPPIHAILQRSSPPRHRSPQRRSPPIHASPQRRSPPRQRSPQRRSPPRHRSPQRRSPPRYRSPQRRSPPRHRSPQRRSPPRHGSLQRRSPPRHRSPQRRSPPRHRSPQRRSPLRYRSPQRRSPPIHASLQRRSPPRQRSPQRRSPPRHRTPERSLQQVNGNSSRWPLPRQKSPLQRSPPRQWSRSRELPLSYGRSPPRYDGSSRNSPPKPNFSQQISSSKYQDSHRHSQHRPRSPLRSYKEPSHDYSPRRHESHHEKFTNGRVSPRRSPSGMHNEKHGSSRNCKYSDHELPKSLILPDAPRIYEKSSASHRDSNKRRGSPLNSEDISRRDPAKKIARSPIYEGIPSAINSNRPAPIGVNREGVAYSSFQEDCSRLKVVSEPRSSKIHVDQRDVTEKVEVASNHSRYGRRPLNDPVETRNTATVPLIPRDGQLTADVRAVERNTKSERPVGLKDPWAISAVPNPVKSIINGGLNPSVTVKDPRLKPRVIKIQNPFSDVESPPTKASKNITQQATKFLPINPF